MRVLHVIDKLNVGGAEKVVVTLTHLLAEQGVSVELLLFNDGGALEENIDKRVATTFLNRNSKWNLFRLYSAHQKCRKYDIVHTHLRHVYAYIRLGQLLFGGKYKLILHDHSAPTPSISWRLKGLFKPEYYVGVNSLQVSWASSKLGIDKKYVHLLENRIAQPSGQVTDISEGVKTMMIANIKKEKNIEFAVQWAKSTGIALDIYGNIQDEEYYNRLNADAADNVRIISGVTDFADLFKLYSMAIHCSPSETGPLVLLEYLNVGLPFIAYNTGSIAAHISKTFPQLFMNNFEMADWQQRVAEIRKDATLPQRMRQLFVDDFKPSEYADKCVEIYQSVLCL